jgi:hypothetical protein
MAAEPDWLLNDIDHDLNELKMARENSIPRVFSTAYEI